MAHCSVNARCPVCNQSLLSLDVLVQFSGRIEQLEYAVLLLTRARAMTTIATGDALDQCTRSDRHHYMSAVDEQIEAALNIIDDVTCAFHRLE